MKVALLWDGFTDPTLTYQQASESFEVAYLLTFIPEKWTFPLKAMGQECEKLGTKLFLARINAPYIESCRDTLQEMLEDFEIRGIIPVEGLEEDTALGGWMENLCDGTGIELVKNPTERSNGHPIKTVLGYDETIKEKPAGPASLLCEPDTATILS